MKKKISGTSPTPLKWPIFGERKPKWAISARRVCATVLTLLAFTPEGIVVGF